MQLVVDAHTANIPWELLTVPLAGSESDSLANLGGLVRRFAERDSFRLAPSRPSGETALVIGAGRVDGQAPLPGTLDEAITVKEILTAHCRNDRDACTLRTDDKAPLDAVDLTNLLLGEYRYLHIASHGTFDDDGRTSAALLGPDFRLTPTFVKAMRVVPDVVFLNCCKLAKVGGQRFAPGIARELMAMGVKAVVAAGWNISDVAAVGFAKVFWSSLTRGDSFGMAVRSARQEAAQLGSGNTWAAYQCYGDPSFRMTARRRTGATAEMPTSSHDLVRDIQALAVRATDIRSRDVREIAKRLQALREELVQLRGVADRSTFCGVVEVHRQLGAAARQLGMFDIAVIEYRTTLVKAGSERATDLEQLANVEARHAQRLARGLAVPSILTVGKVKRERPTGVSESAEGIAEEPPETAAALFEAALGHIRLALGLGASRERSGIEGSVFKKWATLPGLPDGRKTELVKEALAAYARRDDGGYGLENVKQLTTLVPGATTIDLSMDQPAKSGNEVLIDERHDTVDFWTLAAEGDRAITGIMRTSSRFEATIFAQRAASTYTTAFQNRSSVAERDSVITHITDLADLVPAGSAQHEALALVRAELIGWESAASASPIVPVLDDPTAVSTMGDGAAARGSGLDATVRMMPAGPGDALVVSWGPPSDRFTMLIDGGLKVDETTGLGRYLNETLNRYVDLLVVTHIDADHVKGAIEAVAGQRLTYGDVWFNGGNELIADRSVAQGRRFDALTLGQNRNRCVTGQAIVIPDVGPLPTTTLRHGARITFLSPDRPRLAALEKAWTKAPSHRGSDGSDGFDELDGFLQDSSPDRGDPSAPVKWGGDTSVPNGSSIAFLLEVGDTAMVFTGDAWSDVLEASLARLLAERSVSRLRLDVFKVSHHASTNNISPTLLDFITCDHFLISTDGSRHGHPCPETITLIQAKHPNAKVHLHHTPEVASRVGTGPAIEWVTDQPIM
jgi:beta-lactamase superfamily II metal-dependent hydrolase